MTKTKSTKRALLTSALALLMCVSMLIGSTFAWFTDSVTSSGNIIKSGTLDVTMEWADGTKAVPADDSSDWTDASKGAIFKSELWEPGYTEVRHIKIANEGTLALKYQLNIIANGEVSKLADVIDVYYVDPAVQVADRTALTDANKLGTLTEVLANISTTASGNLKATEKHTITLALKMQEDAGNEYQDLAIGSDFSIQLLATQLTHESDSFNNQYDDIVLVSDATALADAIAAGKNVMLTNDIVMNNSVSLGNADFVLDGNGHTITMADGATNTIALFDIYRGKATIKDVTFDGIKEGAIVRTVGGVEFNADNVTAVNGNHTQVQGIFRLLGKSTITNCTFKNNTCNMVISLNYDGANNDPQVVKNCVFENNTCNATGVLYYVKGESCTLDGNKFVGNTVNCNKNGATVYMGFTENNTITNNVFKNNIVKEASTSKRVAGALMVGYETVITNNAFIDNKVEGTNAKGNDVCASVYYTDIDLSGNYWGGEAPVENDNYFVEYPDKNNVIINDYLTTYSN